MAFTIRERADIVGTYRYVAVSLMETLARWVPTTPELEAKVLFGRHIWDLAQHADQFGQRTAELRVALHHNREPVESFREILSSLDETRETARRIAGLYDVMLPDLTGRYDRYLETTDHLLDEPTVRIVERVLRDIERMCSERDALLVERPDLILSDTEWRDRLAEAVGAQADFVDYRPPATAVEARI